jgi:hypothetical protein
MSEWPPGVDALSNAALAASIDGREPLLRRDREALARGLRHLTAGRDHAATATLAQAMRRTTMLASATEALAALNAAADAAGIERERALRIAIRGILDATTPKL